MSSSLSRRDLLARSTTLATLGATGAVAGCTELDVLGGADTDFRTRLRRWLPAPDTIPVEGDRPEQYGFAGVDAAALRSAPDRVDEALRRTPADSFERLGVDPSAVDVAIALGSGRIGAGDFDGEAVADSLAAEGLERDGTDGDFRLFRGPLPPAQDGVEYGTNVHRVAVSDGHVVEVPLEFFEPGALEAILDTHAGDSRRYAESDPAIGDLIGLADGLLFLSVTPTERIPEDGASPRYGNFAGVVATGNGYAVSGDRIRFHRLFAFDGAEAAADADVDAFVATQTATDGDSPIEHVETNVDGRTVEAVFGMPVEELVTPSST